MTRDPRAIDGPGWVVRVRASGGITYTSERMVRVEAEKFADDFETTVSNAAANRREFVHFVGEGGGTHRIRTDRVITIDPVCFGGHGSGLGPFYESRPVVAGVETR